MSCLCFTIITWVCFIRLIQSSNTELASNTCDDHLNLQKQLTLLNGTYPACRDVDNTRKLTICEIDEKDVSDTCSISSDPIPCPKSTCPDGSWNRTCYPVPRNDVIYAFKCVCHSAAHIWDVADVRATFWSDLEPLDQPVGGAYFARRLTMIGGGCIAREFIKIGPIVYGHNLPDSVYTASSSYSSNYPPYKAHIKQYMSGHCAWIPKQGDNDKWLGITLPGDYITEGVIISRLCSPLSKYPGVVTVTTSHDDVTWLTPADSVDLIPLYDADHNAYIWFSTRYTTRFWRIRFVPVGGNPRMKSDLIGAAV